MSCEGSRIGPRRDERLREPFHRNCPGSGKGQLKERVEPDELRHNQPPNDVV
jgi:hypothetical protein